MSERKPVLSTHKHQLKRVKDQFKTIFVSTPISRLKRIDVVREDSWNQFIMTEVKL